MLLVILSARMTNSNFAGLEDFGRPWRLRHPCRPLPPTTRASVALPSALPPSPRTPEVPDPCVAHAPAIGPSHRPRS
jgi:hypothetical protein